MRHQNETVAFFAVDITPALMAPDFCSGLASTQPMAGMEYDVPIEVGVARLDHTITTIQFANAYTNPVVFAGIPTHNGGHEGVVRIHEIRRTSFDLYFDEPACLDETHATETVSYMVVESGWWGTLQIGRLDTTSTTVETWHHVPYLGPLEGEVVVFSQVQTHGDNSWVKTRQRDVNECGWEVMLEEDGTDGHHGFETIGWMATTAGVGYAGGLLFEAVLTPDAVTHRPHEVSFTAGFTNAPGECSASGKTVARSCRPSASQL